MKALLICPAFRRGLAELAVPGPLATAPVFGEAITTHWIEQLAALGARHVRIIAADRATHLRCVLGDGGRWGVQLEVLAVPDEPTPAEAAARYRPAGESDWLPAPHDVVLIDRLPGAAALPMFDHYAGWFAALLAWMPHAVTPLRVRVREIRPGIWVGRRARVASTAELIAPCWIGDQVSVAPGAVVGPGAIIEDRSVVEDEARVGQSWVGPDTLVGPLTSVNSSLAWGDRLTNWRTGSSLRVPDPFLLCSLAPPPAWPAITPMAPAVVAAVPSARRRLSWLPAWAASVGPAPNPSPPACPASPAS